MNISEKQQLIQIYGSDYQLDPQLTDCQQGKFTTLAT